LVFASVNIVVLVVLIVVGAQYYYSQPDVFGGRRAIQYAVSISVLYAAYLVGFLVAVRLIVGVVRINNHPRAEIGLAALVAVAVLAALIPYSIGMHLHEYRPFGYSTWQITNWAWTLGLVADGRDMTGFITIIVVFVVMVFFASLLLSPGVVFPRRTATPERVKKERKAMSQG
jgi:hypothetical protein